MNNNNILTGGISPLLLRRRMMTGRDVMEVNWNQLVRDPLFEHIGSYWNNEGQNTVNVSQNILSLVITNNNAPYLRQNGIPVESGNLLYGCVNSFSSSENVGRIRNGSLLRVYMTSNIHIGRENGFDNWRKCHGIFTATGTSTNGLYDLYDWDTNINHLTMWTNPRLINISLLFAEHTIIDLTVAQFESWLQENGINPNEYIPYCAGETRIMTKPSWIQ